MAVPNELGVGSNESGIIDDFEPVQPNQVEKEELTLTFRGKAFKNIELLREKMGVRDNQVVVSKALGIILRAVDKEIIIKDARTNIQEKIYLWK